MLYPQKFVLHQQTLKAFELKKLFKNART